MFLIKRCSIRAIAVSRLPISIEEYLECDRGDSDPYVVTKPLLIVEVLSPSTERIDREEKLHNYRQLDSLEEYVLVTPETKEAEVHRRVEGLWKVEAYAGEGILQFASVGLILTLEEVFTGLSTTAS
jgi:Uma2 family endonuclease